MSAAFNEIIIIYNPISTGNSKVNAEQFAKALNERMPNQAVTLVKSEYSGHAEKIAASYTGKKGKWLIISSSGDGGYNEVVNGVLGGKKKGVVVTSVLPSGNANDHHAAMSSEDPIDNIKNANIETIDIIQVTSAVNGKPWVRYAHSYAGFGITPKIGRELTVKKLNSFNEKWYVFRHLLAFKHVRLEVDGATRRYSSLVFATISKMSKIIQLADDASQYDGKMEIYETEYRSPLGMLKLLFRASLAGLTESKRLTTYKLRTIRPTLIQLDGEVEQLDQNTDITIRCLKQKLQTIL
ncbi:MAG TPA: diacylglycerol kinase family protein [Candidatus Saccharibacteria bacterium]|nr:diacylglycerol kinase family protein [Candidatus Saccharibacteria bacterium]HRK94449.1 diacylglycerol kinase family protein [Candidatus Saccharibacteria bacterium]